MTICIFSGTFNPIHNGHIKMADFALKNFNFDKIIFIPAYIPPHKQVGLDLAQHRLSMVKIATSINPRFEVSDIEYKENAPSYSVNTVKKIIKKYNIKERLNFIIGTDAFKKIESWYHSDELKNLVHFIVFPRIGDDIESIKSEFKQKGWDFEIVECDFFNVSSTEIRKNFSSNQIDKKVKDYINGHDLYRN